VEDKEKAKELLNENQMEDTIRYGFQFEVA
jgi:hypothetical protein